MNRFRPLWPCAAGLVACMALLWAASCSQRAAAPPGPGLRALSLTTIYGDVADGRIQGGAAVYTDAWTTSSAGWSDVDQAPVGQRLFSGTYNCWRAFFRFDTSALAGAEVLTASLCIMPGIDASTTDFQGWVYRFAWSEPLLTDREGNYDGAFGPSATLEGELFNTASTFVSGTLMCLALDPAGINTAGDTAYTLVSARDVSMTVPSAAEYAWVWQAESSEAAYRSFLSLSYNPPTPTPTNTHTPTPTATPTVTPICPVSLESDTTWGPGPVRVECNVGVAEGVTLTLAAGTEVRFTGDYHLDVAGTLLAVGSAASPITLTSEVTTTAGAWGWLYLRGESASMEYVNSYYGEGLNLASTATLSHVGVYSSTYGLSFMGPWAATVSSSTLRYNGTGLLFYNGAAPTIANCNVLDSSGYDGLLWQAVDITTTGCWWGADPPDDARVHDAADDFRLGALDRSDYAAAWVAW